MSAATVDKDRPSAEWIAELRRRLPVEPEIDRVLVRKLLRRARGPYRPQSLQSLIDGVTALISASIGGSFQITDAQWLTGGASKLQMAFTLRSPASPDTRLVLRMEPAASVCETSRLREFELLRNFDDV